MRKQPRPLAAVYSRKYTAVKIAVVRFMTADEETAIRGDDRRAIGYSTVGEIVRSGSGEYFPRVRGRERRVEETRGVGSFKI